MSAITIVGSGYVGLVSAACFARLGHDVTCVEIDSTKIRALQRNHLPIREPGLADLWEENAKQKRLRVTNDYREALRESDFVFLAVGTPSRPGGAADLRQVIAATTAVAQSLNCEAPPTVVIKSTVPLGTAELLAQVLKEHHPSNPPAVVSNPEFLREGQAIVDFLRPARIVIGADDRSEGEKVAQLYQQLRRPVIFCDVRTAEMIKYAANAFLCTKISFANEIAALCEEAGVDVVDVSRALGLDSRIGHNYLEAGLGWGGSCLPKDINALIWAGSKLGVSTPILRSAVRINRRQPRLVISKLTSLLGSLEGATIGIWGLAFKPNCDDVRESPALNLIRLLLGEGCRVKAFDPLAMEAASREFPEITYCPDAYEAAADTDAVVLATHWRSFETLDLARVYSTVSRPILVDARNALDSERVIQAGFVYVGIGLPTRGGELVTPESSPMPLPVSKRRLASLAYATKPAPEQAE